MKIAESHSLVPGMSVGFQARRFCRLVVLTVVIAVLICLPSQGADSLESAAGLVQRATVTVRVTVTESESDASATEAGTASAATDAPASGQGPKVLVGSGVLVGDGWVVTSAMVAAAPAQVRLTFPDGTQARCRVRVVDEYSGLALLQLPDDLDNREQVTGRALKLSDAMPAVGSWVLSAAGWGAEQPVVSLGVIGGQQRTIRGATYPPLLQCDFRTALTSSGAAVVNADGALVGIVVAAESAAERGGWNYAVPVDHVRRLLRIAEQSNNHDADATDDASVTVLKRLRPTVGMILEGQRQQVVVKRVTQDSPAHRAGIRSGDEILEVAGVKVRSVYQAVRPVLYKQPGDVVRFRVRQIDGVRHLDVVLGGALEVERSAGRLTGFVQPALEVQRSGPGVYQSRSAEQLIQQFTSPDPDSTAQDLLPELPAATAEEKLELLQQALDGYRQVILLQQEQLRAARKEIEALKQENPAADREDP